MPFGGLLTMGLISAGTSIAGSAIGGSKGSRTSTQTPIFTPGQTAVQGALGSDLQSELAGGGAGIAAQLAPLEATAAGSINSNYAGIQQRMQQANASRGFGRSGSTVANSDQLQIARQGDLGDLASRFAGYNLQQQNTEQQQAQQFAFADPGSSNVGAGSALASGLGALSGILSSASGGGGSGIGSILSGITGDGVQQQVNAINTPSTATIDPADQIGSAGNYGSVATATNPSLYGGGD